MLPLANYELLDGKQIYACTATYSIESIAVGCSSEACMPNYRHCLRIYVLLNVVPLAELGLSKR